MEKGEKEREVVERREGREGGGRKEREIREKDRK